MSGPVDTWDARELRAHAAACDVEHKALLSAALDVKAALDAIHRDADRARETAKNLRDRALAVEYREGAKRRAGQ